MTQPSPAGTLRAAAEKLRDAATNATPDICPEWTANAIRHVARKAAIDCSHDEHQDTPPEWDPHHDAPYFAVMHPGVGAALADWLDHHALAVERLRNLFDGELPAGSDRYPLAVARAILQEQP